MTSVTTSSMDGTVFMNWAADYQQEALYRLLTLCNITPESYGVSKTNSGLSDLDFQSFAHGFKAKRNIEIALSHKAFIVRTFKRFKDAAFPNLTLEFAEAHDNSKVNSFVEVVGYTERWVHGRHNSEFWKPAKLHHYAHNSHHPEFHVNADGSLNPMPASDLEESVVDMLAIQWERRFAGREDVTGAELADVDERYLDRYLPEDREKVRVMLRVIAGCGLPRL
ncbi:hypothetical protein HDU98_010454 [Podochytrium sp. JEL0797]|nr:hypothetical protein HDU98_010454 [Podochytrium sp. JEL0797]